MQEICAQEFVFQLKKNHRLHITLIVIVPMVVKNVQMVNNVFVLLTEVIIVHVVLEWNVIVTVNVPGQDHVIQTMPIHVTNVNVNIA